MQETNQYGDYRPSVPSKSIADQDFQILADLLPDYVARYDTQGRIKYINHALRCAMQRNINELLGRKLSEIFADGRFEELEHRVVRCAETRRPDEMDLTVPDFSANIEYHHIRIAPELAVSGDIVGVIALGRNMTDRLMLEQRIISNSRLSSLGEMAGGIAHEINNPLAVIQGRCRRIQKLMASDRLMPDELAKSVETIISTVGRISRIIRGLKTVSRDGGGDPFTPTYVQVIIDDAFSLCEEKIKNANIQLFNRSSTQKNLVIDCRPTQIGQILVNLLCNSYDAVIDTEKPWISLEVSDDDRYAFFAVTDSGNGIPKQLISKLMQPFFTTKQVGKGTGLGLSLSNSFAKDHGGELFVDTQCRNTRFVLKIPKRQDASQKG